MSSNIPFHNGSQPNGVARIMEYALTAVFSAILTTAALYVTTIQEIKENQSVMQSRQRTIIESQNNLREEIKAMRDDVYGPIFDNRLGQWKP